MKLATRIYESDQKKSFETTQQVNKLLEQIEDKALSNDVLTAFMEQLGRSGPGNRPIKPPGVIEQLETNFKQADVLPMVKHYMDGLNLFELFKKYVPTPSDCLLEHAESLCILTANIICDNKPLIFFSVLYAVQL